MCARFCLSAVCGGIVWRQTAQTKPRPANASRTWVFCASVAGDVGLLARPAGTALFNLPHFSMLSVRIFVKICSCRRCIRCSRGCQAILLLASEQIGEATTDDIEDWREDEAEHGYTDHAEEHSGAQRLAHFGTGA